jgi:hypothetical protein
MSKHGTWTVVFGDQMVIKRTGEFDRQTAKGYNCGGSDFWFQQKFSNVHAIQFTDDNLDNDQVEFKDHSPNGIYDASLYGDFQQFIDLWDAANLSTLQGQWDNNNISTGVDAQGAPIMETAEEKITRLGPRPTTYTS